MQKVEGAEAFFKVIEKIAFAVFLENRVIEFRQIESQITLCGTIADVTHSVKKRSLKREQKLGMPLSVFG